MYIFVFHTWAIIHYCIETRELYLPHLVGHGQSEGARIHVDNYQTYVRDVIQHLEIIKTKHPDLPLFVIGESMVCTFKQLTNSGVCIYSKGGLITALTVVERPQLLTGVVLSAPTILDNRATSFQVRCYTEYSSRVFLEDSLARVISSNEGIVSSIQYSLWL